MKTLKEITITLDTDNLVDKTVLKCLKETARKNNMEEGDVLVEFAFGKILESCIDYKYNNGKKPHRNLFKHWTTINMEDE
jgi:hypothetical protein